MTIIVKEFNILCIIPNVHNHKETNYFVHKMISNAFDGWSLGRP